MTGEKGATKNRKGQRRTEWKRTEWKRKENKMKCTPAISKRLFEGEEMDCVEVEGIVGELMG